MEKTHRCHRCGARRFEFYLFSEHFGRYGRKWACKNKVLCDFKIRNPRSSAKSGRRY